MTIAKARPVDHNGRFNTVLERLSEEHLDRRVYEGLAVFFPVVLSFEFNGRARDNTFWLVLADAIQESEYQSAMWTRITADSVREAVEWRVARREARRDMARGERAA